MIHSTSLPAAIARTNFLPMFSVTYSSRRSASHVSPSAFSVICGNAVSSPSTAEKGTTVAPIQQNAFREFKVYDKMRQPAEWTSLVGPTQCAVFLKDVETANPLATDGSEIGHLSDCRFLLFDYLEEARAFCEAQVQRYPFMCCEIFDAQGKAKPPLLVIMHSTAARKDELSPTWLKRRKVIAIASLVAAPALFIADWRSEYELLWPSLLAVNLLFFGLRLLYWNTASAERRQTQAKRLEEHLRREREAHRDLHETR